jgi:hypothetical protein
MRKFPKKILNIILEIDRIKVICQESSYYISYDKTLVFPWVVRKKRACTKGFRYLRKLHET